ncbi:uncharacterized protein MONOS_10440 [Monocercomonoides exilis]|uniref:uncharacterized protein n=1 Tax=Monocercomonoides exilis TaxID=2049356 RepID=UPI00355AC104|nr:hypothetical protein MONOS_10440 [Monocercomonoides exilis]|eukprot:MONOS_10440.1-p1 / transcript=MONOS_10440.1 / gene=MONOS_10440 / organism=Monocercomonoides_exilis_PA203 / gene_product=unspecified product / transcript_product=unspecified product / location=Mono_scaffold00475:33547-33957(-) / protein_length=137 / sequence_SO=supercontig / SO=protein_coding / is_pseudo=false
MDIITKAQNVLNVLSSQFIDALGEYPRKAEETFKSKPQESQILIVQQAEAIMKNILQCSVEFDGLADSIRFLGDENNQRERIIELTKALKEADEEIKDLSTQTEEMLGTLKAEREDLVQSFLGEYQAQSSSDDSVE